MRLDAWARRWSGPGARVRDLRRLSGGASQELWAFDVVDDEGRRELILRRLPGGQVKRAVAAGMEIEARLIRLARAKGAPVPDVVDVCKPEDGLGSAYIMSRVPGETLARRRLSDPVFTEARERLADQLGAAVAQPALVDHLWATTLATVAIDQPTYATYRRAVGSGSTATYS